MNLTLLMIAILACGNAHASPLEEDPIAIVARADYGFSGLLQGHFRDRFLLCQGEDYPVQFKLEYANTAGELFLTALSNLHMVADHIRLRTQSGNDVHGTQYDPASDYGYANFFEVAPTSGFPFQVTLDLHRANLALDNVIPGLSFNTREVSILGQAEGMPSVHSFHSDCGFYYQ